MPDVLRPLPSAERARHVVAALNALAPRPDEEQPGAPQPDVEAAIRRRVTELRVDEARAAAIEVLMAAPSRDPLSLYIRETIQGRPAALPAGALGPWLTRFFDWLGIAVTRDDA